MKIGSVSTLKYFLLWISCGTIFSYISVHAQTQNYVSKRPKNYPKEIAKHYLNFFANEKKKIKKLRGKKRKKKKHKAYEIPRPALSEAEVISILLLQVFREGNKAMEEFLQKQLKNGAVDMQPATWKAMHILPSSADAPDNHLLGACLRPGALSIEEAALALLLVTPTTNIKTLKKSQAATAALLEKPAVHTRLKELYEKLQEELPAIISLYSKDLDPMCSIAYQKKLQKTYYNQHGRFTKSWLVNIHQFWVIYIWLVELAVSLYIAVQGYKDMDIYKGRDEKKRQELYGISILFFALFLWTLYAYPTQYLMEKTINDYICGRITDVKTLLEVAQEISNTIGSDPRLEALYGDKLTHTRKLLALQHENPAYNETVEIILNNNFKNRNLFFNCISKVLYTMTLLQENIHMLDETLFELGHLGTFLCIADLLQNPDNNQNTFSFVNYFSEEEKADVYINLKNNWSVSVDSNEAVLNDIFIDGASHNTAVITGSDKCDSTILMKAVFESALLAQTLSIIPGTGSLTPFSLFYVYKDSPNPSLGKPLFAKKIKMSKLYKQTLQYYHKQNKKTLTFFDKYLNSTDIAEENEKSRAFIVDIIQKFPKNANFISTRNPSLIKKLNALDKSVMIQC